MPWSVENKYSDIERLIKRYPGLYRAVYKVIEEVDPSDLAFIENEYNIEVYDIIYNLKDCTSPADVREMVIYIFDYWLSSGQKLKQYEGFEERIWEIRNKIKEF